MESIAGGWQRFLAEPPKFQFVMIMGTLVGMLLFLSLLKGFGDSPVHMRMSERVPIVCAFWFVLGYAPFLFFSADSRHNLFPALAAAALCGMLLARLRTARFAIVVAFFVLGLSGCGTALAWRDAGKLHHGIYATIEERKSDWQEAAVFFVDTTALRSRNVRGLFEQPTYHARYWAYYHNALMPRGFSYSSMLELAGRKGDLPRVVVDAERFTRWEGERLIWHARFDDTRQYSTARSEVFVLALDDLMR